MDIASLIGIVACLGLVMFGIVSGDDGMAAIGFFVDPPSMLITFGGSFMATMASVTLPDFIGGLKSFTLIFKTESANIPEMITKIIDLSNVARKEGLLSLEEAASDLDDAFMKKGILLIVDGTDPELVRGILETELVSIEGRHKDKIGFWETLGSMGSCMGYDRYSGRSGYYVTAYDRSFFPWTIHGNSVNHNILWFPACKLDLRACRQ